MEKGRTNENVVLPIEVLEGGSASVLVSRVFPGQESSHIKILSRIQVDLLNNWMFVKGRPERVNMIKRCLFVGKGGAPTRSMLHEYVYLNGYGKKNVEIITVKKTDMLRAGLGLKTLERRLFGLILEDTPEGGDLRVQPVLSYGEFKSDVAMHIKKLRVELQEIARDFPSMRA
jgi:hypothetical protein